MLNSFFHCEHFTCTLHWIGWIMDYLVGGDPLFSRRKTVAEANAYYKTNEFFGQFFKIHSTSTQNTCQRHAFSIHWQCLMRS